MKTPRGTQVHERPPVSRDFSRSSSGAPTQFPPNAGHPRPGLRAPSATWNAPEISPGHWNVRLRGTTPVTDGPAPGALPAASFPSNMAPKGNSRPGPPHSGALDPGHQFIPRLGQYAARTSSLHSRLLSAVPHMRTGLKQVNLLDCG